MYQIQNLTSDAKQAQTLILPDGSAIEILIEYKPMQLGWFISTLTYKEFVLNGLRITNQPDMLYQFKNQIPFGLMCVSAQDREPYLQDDFLSGLSQLFILSDEEVTQYTEFLSE